MKTPHHRLVLPTLLGVWLFSGGVVARAQSVVIASNSDLAALAASGTGSPADPYIIGPLTINNVNGVAVNVDGTKLTKSFVLYDLSIAGNGAATTVGILLENINASGVQAIRAKVAGGSIQTTTDVGVRVINSSYVVLDGLGASQKQPGISNPVGTINKNTNGAVDIENSSHITVKGWQFSADGMDGTPDWLTFNPSVKNWAVGGVRFFGVTYSTIDHNAANNCTSVSFSLFHSSSNSITSNTADYPFTMNLLITDGSSSNTVSNNVFGTGDFIGILVADPLPRTATLKSYGPTHDNLISGNIVHGDGPTGNELSANVVPAFLGGIVVLNGTTNNQILNNQLWANTGNDLVWAQAVPNSGTPIGVTTYPPVLDCNVTASEGGGGVSNLNGNVWSGNVIQTAAVCIPPQ